METVTVRERVPIARRALAALDPKQVQVLGLDGKVIPPADWDGVIGEKTTVIVSPGGKAVPDELRAAHKDVRAVIVIKPK